MRPQKGKQKLLNAALNLFESQGYFSTTIEQITVEAGVSKGLVYNYFRSKEELLSALVENATVAMLSTANELMAPQTVEESFSQFIDSFFGFLKTERRFLKLQLTLLLMPELQQIVSAPQRRRANLLLDTLCRWFREAGTRDARKKARILLAALDGVALHFLCIYENYPLASMKTQLLQLTQLLCADQIEPTHD